jgi:PhzF family phenazine biosynthesis protein
MSRFGQPIYVVDAFAERPFAGNPAAVCPLTGPADASWMQSVAAEMNHAETAFLYPTEGAWRLRWFTPTVEVDLCGHATLAAAHVLWESGRAQLGTPLSFQTRSGVLTVASSGERYEMNFPTLPVSEIQPPADFAKVLGAAPVWVGRNDMDLFAELSNEATVRFLKPDLSRLAGYPVRGVIVTAPAAEFDFVSRFFAPASGVPEDPVTGSAHCALGPYWASKLGRTTLNGFQASPRGGRVRVTVRGERVLLGGGAVTVLSGELSVPPPPSDVPWPEKRRTS